MRFNSVRGSAGIAVLFFAAAHVFAQAADSKCASPSGAANANSMSAPAPQVPASPLSNARTPNAATSDARNAHFDGSDSDAPVAPLQTQTPPVQAARKPSLERQFFQNILKDQRAIWTSPLHLHAADALWLGPLAAGTAVLLVTDDRTAEEGGEFNNNSTHSRVSSDLSRLGAGYLDASVAGGFYLVGLAAGNARARETGLLAGEAMIDSAIVVGALKGVARRPRPGSSNNDGDFFRGGNSFPSGHTITAWTLATVVAQEYGKHRWVGFAAYSLAALVGAGRFTGHNHYLSDVLVGGAIGYGVGRYVYHAHHDPVLDDDSALKRKIITSKFFPAVMPRYSALRRDYGLSLRWGL